jgi:hypothetical protein
MTVQYMSGGQFIQEFDDSEYVVKDAWNTTGTHTIIGSNNNKFYIYNTGNADLSFTINSITFTVKPLEEFEEVFDSFSQVIISATSTFNANVSGLKSGSSNPTYSVKDFFSGSTNTTRSFSGPVYGIIISNDGISALTYNVNGIILTVESGDVVERNFDALTQVIITSTVAFRAYVKGILNSTITGSITDTTAPIVTASPNGGLFNATQNVALNANETSTIYYTTDSSTPTVSSSVYSSPISITANTTLKFFGRDAAGNNSSVQIATFTIDMVAPNPVTSLTAGTPMNSTIPVSWTLSSSGDVVNQEVAYSTDGTNFTVASAVVNSASTSYTVTGLTTSTLYTIRVVAIDGANNRSTVATVQATTTSATVSNITDDFNRTDNTASLGVATTGQTWTAIVGTWGIIGNQAYCVSSSTDACAVVESGKADATIQAKFATITSTNMRLAFRVVDSNNLILVNTDATVYTLYKRVAGAYTSLGTSSGVTPTNGDIIKVVTSGSSITVYVNSVQVITATCTDHQTATKHGLGNNIETTARYDDFSII